jgi:hypothetical protein
LRQHVLALSAFTDGIDRSHPHVTEIVIGIAQLQARRTMPQLVMLWNHRFSFSQSESPGVAGKPQKMGFGIRYLGQDCSFFPNAKC